MKQPNDNKVYTAALYLRLSEKDDNTDKDSVSIETQRDMLTRFCQERNIIIYDYYADDGFTGTNFDRPAFKRMIGDIEAGKVNCVITKDQSRLGRNYIESGYYMEIYFPEHGIRYIAVNDNVDTINSSSLDIAPFKNLLNDMYANDISRKTKSAICTMQRQGKFTGHKAPYGYLKDPNDKHHLIIDEKTAPVVRMIYDMYLEQGMGGKRIAKALTEARIPRPAYEVIDIYPKYANVFDPNDDSRYHWNDATVRYILKEPAYAGNFMGQKTPTISAKSGKRKPYKSEAFIVENTHEPIIEQDRWDMVQKIMKSRRREQKHFDFTNIFSGLLYCCDCGHLLYLTRSRKKLRDDPIDMYGYSCCHYVRAGKESCSRHWIEARDLYNAVLDDIHAQAQRAVENDKKMMSDIAAVLKKEMLGSRKDTQRNLRKAKTRHTELVNLFSKLYEDKVKGNITEYSFKQLSAKYEAEQLELEQYISEQEKLNSDKKEIDAAADTFVNLVKDYAEVTELNAAILNKLIEKIIVHSAVMENGEKTQEIEIFYKFVGKIEG